MPRPIPPDRRAAIVTDIKAGGACNDIARRHGVSASTVSKIAKDEHITGAFERAQTQNATRAKRIDYIATRVRLIAKYYQKAEHLLDRVDAPYTVPMSGPADIVMVTTRLPPLRDAQAGMAASAIGVDKALKLEAADSQDGAEGLAEVDQWVRGMLGGDGLTTGGSE